MLFITGDQAHSGSSAKRRTRLAAEPKAWSSSPVRVTSISNMMGAGTGRRRRRVPRIPRSQVRPCNRLSSSERTVLDVSPGDHFGTE